MIFSNKIYKVIDGKNPTLYQQDDNILNLYIFNKSLKRYQIQINNKRNCVFLNNYNYTKIIQLENEIYCPCSNEFITKVNENIL